MAGGAGGGIEICGGSGAKVSLLGVDLVVQIVAVVLKGGGRLGGADAGVVVNGDANGVGGPRSASAQSPSQSTSSRQEGDPENERKAAHGLDSDVH